MVQSVTLDVDGVLYRWGRAVRKTLKRRYGIDVDSEVFFAEEHVSPDVWAWVWSDAGVREIFGTGESFPGAVRFAQWLGRNYWLRIASACPKAAWNPRKHWLAQRNIRYDEFVGVIPPAPRSGIGTDGKSHASKSLILPHTDVYIDDNSNNCDELVQNTKALVLLVDHSWNQGGDGPKSRSKRLIRVHDWEEAKDAIRGT